MSQAYSRRSISRGGTSSFANGNSVGTNMLTNTFRSRATATSENEIFRKRNNVQTNYCGPVFVSEEVYVPCAACSAPVNAVERVPVGKSWYHPNCLHCHICKIQSRTLAFYAVNGFPLCVNCYGAGGGNFSGPKNDHRISSSSFLADNNLLTLSNGVRLDARTSTMRQLTLMEKQAVVVANDPNVVLALPPISSLPPNRRESASRASPPRIGDSNSQLRLESPAAALSLPQKTKVSSNTRLAITHQVQQKY